MTKMDDFWKMEKHRSEEPEKCIYCKENFTYTYFIDPFDDDIKNKITKKFFCDDCEEEAKEDHDQSAWEI
jgi:hypothetical protein